VYFLVAGLFNLCFLAFVWWHEWKKDREENQGDTLKTLISSAQQKKESLSEGSDTSTIVPTAAQRRIIPIADLQQRPKENIEDN